MKWHKLVTLADFTSDLNSQGTLPLFFFIDILILMC